MEELERAAREVLRAWDDAGLWADDRPGEELDAAIYRLASIVGYPMPGA